ncbi:MAG: hypothetical protein J0M30_07040 [Chitinophagales bacterium]|nr:hypothetical protein [Chitinophagales bacterium]
MNLFKILFGKKKNIGESKRFDKNKNDYNLTSEAKFASLSSEERLGAIMSLGDTGQNRFFDLLKFSIQSDPDIDVRFAALKRIHLFKEHPSVIPFLKSLSEDKKQTNLEPYLSMALSRVGIISPKELQNRINNPTVETTTTNNQRWTNFDKGSSIGTTGSEGGKITEDFECIDGARVTIEKDGAIAPYSVTLGIYGLMFHTHFASAEIEAKQFMDFAVKKIDEIFALYETAEIERDTTWNAKHDRLLSELAEQKNGG